MLKKILTLTLSLTLYSQNSLAMVSFTLENSPFIKNLKVEDHLMLIQDKKQDFSILYNKKNEMLYLKHKNLTDTFKIPVSKVKSSRFSTALKAENTNLELLNYNTKLFSINFAGRECFQFYGAKDLDLDSSASSAYNLYKAFVYFTGQLELPRSCKNLNISEYFDAKTGFPLAVFHEGKQVKLTNMKNEKLNIKKFLKSIKLNSKKAKKPSLELQYELMFSLLTEKQQEIFLADSKNKPLSIKIKAIDNLLKGF